MAASASGDQFMPQGIDRNWKPHLEIAPDCPRCASANTKFCYYNNYSLSQPRYFCKGCRRYWTKGGSLRNVPVGGGCRKSRRSSKSSRSAALRATPTAAPETHKGSCSGDSSSSSTAAAGSDIDMAVVFAKFLNPDSAGAKVEPGLVDGGSNSNSISSTPESCGMVMSAEQDGFLFPPTAAAGNSFEFFDLFREDGFLEAGIGGGEDQHQESMINSLGLQTLLSDEMAQLEAAMWSSTAGNDPVPATAAWETPQPQEQGFDAGDFGIANNWGCYDLQQFQGIYDISHHSLAKPPTNY
ncbi:unnamed protein product [Linum trigynum]